VYIYSLPDAPGARNIIGIGVGAVGVGAEAETHGGEKTLGGT